MSLLITLFLWSLSEAADYTCDTDLDTLYQYANNANALLKAQGYDVLEGKMWFPGIDIFGNNPSGTYGVYDFGEVPDTGLNLSVPAFSLGPNDAVFFFGCTPPPSEYFSFRSYVYARLEPLSYPFAAPGDTINQDVLNRTSSSSADTPFGKTTLVISTASVTAANNIQNAYLSASGSWLKQATNVDVLPAEWIIFDNLTNPLGDILVVLYRVTLWEDNTQMQQWQTTKWPLYLVRLSSPKQELFPTPPLRQRGTGTTEAYLNSSLESLISTVISNLTSTGATFIERETITMKDLDGYHCLSDPTYHPLPTPFPGCLGGDNDAVYYYSTYYHYLLPETGEFYVLCGVNHPIAGKNLAYSSFAINKQPENGGVVGVNNAKYNGSASYWAPEVPNVDKLYAFTISRQCGSQAYCLGVTDDLLPPQDYFYVTERVYLEEETKTGPLDTELVAAVLLHFGSAKA